jgi:hypothetical protein
MQQINYNETMFEVLKLYVLCTMFNIKSLYTLIHIITAKILNCSFSLYFFKYLLLNFLFKI